MSKSELSGKRGGLCCDYCSDSKFPCIIMEKQMKGELKRDPIRELKKRIKVIVGKSG